MPGGQVTTTTTPKALQGTTISRIKFLRHRVSGCVVPKKVSEVIAVLGGRDAHIAAPSS